MVIAAPEFDTLAHARRLKDAGFDERQAEAAVAMVRHAVTEGVAHQGGYQSRSRRTQNRYRRQQGRYLRCEMGSRLSGRRSTSLLSRACSAHSEPRTPSAGSRRDANRAEPAARDRFTRRVSRRALSERVARLWRRIVSPPTACRRCSNQRRCRVIAFNGCFWRFIMLPSGSSRTRTNSGARRGTRTSCSIRTCPALRTA